ncbi:MAG: hypothetical protein ACFUZC_20990 [Chthoniobacteraceae bacterium]
MIVSVPEVVMPPVNDERVPPLMVVMPVLDKELGATTPLMVTVSVPVPELKIATFPSVHSPGAVVPGLLDVAHMDVVPVSQVPEPGVMPEALLVSQYKLAANACSPQEIIASIVRKRMLEGVDIRNGLGVILEYIGVNVWQLHCGKINFD